MKVQNITQKLPDILQFRGAGKDIKPALKSDIDNYYDTKIWGFDGYDDRGLIRNYLRQRLEIQSLIHTDQKPEANCVKDQLSQNSKYYELGKPICATKSGKKVNICTNLQDMPDFNGLRGKTPLCGKANTVKWRLARVKESGIKTVIDLRSNGEVSKQALAAIDDLELNYFNFPVEDKNWNIKSLENIGDFIREVNKGDYYMGCANGEARTDVAVAINYLFNKEAKNIPDFFLDTKKASGVSIRDNISAIVRIIEKNPEIVKAWGWSEFEDFIKTFKLKYAKLSI